MNLFESSAGFPEKQGRYDARSIEILKGLDPVKRRPGMYTDTTSPDHLVFEVIDNSVDEAIAGFADTIEVILKADGSVKVTDNGRGMPVDMHPEEGISGVELIMTRLHAGAKFSNKNYAFSGGLHGVGVSVVNALSARLDIIIFRNGREYAIGFENGIKTRDLVPVKDTEPDRTGTSVHFYPNPDFFERTTFSTSVIQTALKSKAVLCPGLTTCFVDENTGDRQTWVFDHGLDQYLAESLKDHDTLFDQPFTGECQTDDFQAAWAVNWMTDLDMPWRKAMST